MYILDSISLRFSYRYRHERVKALSLRSALKLEPKIPRLVGQNTRVKEKGKGLSTHAWTLFILKIVMSVMTMERNKKETLVHF